MDREKTDSEEEVLPGRQTAAVNSTASSTTGERGEGIVIFKTGLFWEVMIDQHLLHVSVVLVCGRTSAISYIVCSSRLF